MVDEIFPIVLSEIAMNKPIEDFSVAEQEDPTTPAGSDLLNTVCPYL